MLEASKIYLGDALELMKQLDSGSIDMILTDPPYGHNQNEDDLAHNIEVAMGQRKEAKESRPILNDDEESADKLFRGMLQEARRILKPGACLCTFCPGGGGEHPTFARWAQWMDETLLFKMAVVWDKGPIGLGWHYHRSYEFVMVAQKPGKVKWYDQTHRVENIIRPEPWSKKIIPSADDHPTAKPVGLCARFISWHTEQGDLVLDPFCGGGTTLVAAQDLQRRWIGFELDPKWHGYAEKRVKTAQDQLRLF